MLKIKFNRQKVSSIGRWIFLTGFVFIVILISGINNVPQSSAYIVERFKIYRSTYTSGLFWKIPFVDKVVRKLSLKEQSVNFRTSLIEMRGCVSLQLEICVFFCVGDPKLYAYSVEDPCSVLENLAKDALVHLDYMYDFTSISVPELNTLLMIALNETADECGIKVIRAEVKDFQVNQKVK